MLIDRPAACRVTGSTLPSPQGRASAALEQLWRLREPPRTRLMPPGRRHPVDELAPMAQRQALERGGRLRIGLEDRREVRWTVHAPRLRLQRHRDVHFGAWCD